MSASFSAFLYLISSVCFIMALRGLSSPKTARMGNIYGVAGMVIAVLTTLALPGVVSFGTIILGVLVGETLLRGEDPGEVAVEVVIFTVSK